MMKSHVEFVKVGYSAQDRRLSLVAVLRAAMRQIKRWYELHRQRQQLASLNDEMLKDIGLSRADIEPEVNRPFWDEPFRRG